MLIDGGVVDCRSTEDPCGTEGSAQEVSVCRGGGMGVGGGGKGEGGGTGWVAPNGANDDGNGMQKRK